MTLTPKNWKSFQHYTDRRPAWIKLHRGLLDDFTFSRLPLASKALAPLLWLLASEYDDGAIPCTVEEIAFRLHSSDDEVIEALKPLIDKGFFLADSNMLATCKHCACLEEERETEEQEETEKREIVPSQRSGSTEKPRETFSDWPKDYREQFWTAYPRKQSKKAAFKTLDRLRKTGEVTFAKLLGGIAKIPINEPVFIPHPATWLNRGGWDDEHVPGGANGYRGSRQLQNDSLSVGRAAARVAEEVKQGTITFAPRPSLLPDESQGDLRLLSKG